MFDECFFVNLLYSEELRVTTRHPGMQVASLSASATVSLLLNLVITTFITFCYANFAIGNYIST